MIDRLVYQCSLLPELRIFLETPDSLGEGSGWIPPPNIVFYRERQQYYFIYSGKESDIL